MFGKKNNEPAAAGAAASSQKACCSGKKAKAGGGGEQPLAAGAAAATSSNQQKAEEEVLSSFMFGGEVMEGQLPLVGFCKGPNPEAIQACVWTPGTAVHADNGSGKKGKKKQEQQFTILF